MSNISPKVIDVDSCRINNSDMKMPQRPNEKQLDKPPHHASGYSGMIAIVKVYNDNGRFPTQLFTNIKNDKYKYVKHITMDK